MKDNRWRQVIQEVEENFTFSICTVLALSILEVLTCGLLPNSFDSTTGPMML